MTKIRPMISKKKEYYTTKHEFYVAYHFALQYYEWKAERNSLVNLGTGGSDSEVQGNSISNPTERKGIKIAELTAKIKMVEDSAAEADPVLAKWILDGVTHEDWSYNYLSAKLGMPCGKNMYYQTRRKFYYILIKKLEEKYRKN